LTAGNPVGMTNTLAPAGVTNGLFIVTLDFGVGVFNGAERWLEIGVRSNGGGAFVTLSPRQKLTAAPYAIIAGNLTGTLPATQLGGTLPSAQFGGTYSNTVTFNNAANSFAGNGEGLTNVNAAKLGGLSPAQFWQLGGNNVAAGQFLGSTNNQPLELKINGRRGLRLEPGLFNGPNVIGGYEGNVAGTGTAGATIGGGGAGFYSGASFSNRVDANFGTIGGGRANTIQPSAEDATLGGGNQNTIESGAARATLSGGGRNLIQGGAYDATLSGGIFNTIGSNATHAKIGGGYQNSIGSEAALATVCGGRFNRIGGSSSTIGGGESNTIEATAGYGVISGGRLNSIHSGAYAMIGGGLRNTVRTNAECTTLSGGVDNLIDREAHYATIPGGRENTAAGQYSLAAGHRAKAAHQGAFVWADSNNSDFVSTNADSFSARCVGGARFVSGIDGDGNPLAGVRLAIGGGSWSTLSDLNAKENLQPIDAGKVFQKLIALPLATWNYKAQGTFVRHMGPTAQDFAAAFGVGEDNTTITTVDADGVALAAIQGLNQKLTDELKSRDAENAELKQRLEILEQWMKQKHGGAE
jgi:hypothetical protein